MSGNTTPVGAPKTTFRQFGLDYSRLLSDDYVHKKFLTVKYTGKGERFLLNSKYSLDFKLGADKSEVPSTSSECKVVTNVKGNNIEAKFDSKGLVRFWGNWGKHTIWKPVTLTSKLKTNNTFGKVSGWVNAQYQGEKVDAHLRLDFKDKWHPYFNEKLIYTHDRLKFGYAAKLSLATFNFTRYNFFTSYSHKDFDIFAEHVSRSADKISLGKIILAGVFKHKGNHFIARASYRPEKEDKLRFVLGSSIKVNDKSHIRAKVDSKGQVSLSAKHKCHSNLSVVAGTGINLTNPQAFLTNRMIPIPLGLSIEFAF